MGEIRDRGLAHAGGLGVAGARQCRSVADHPEGRQAQAALFDQDVGGAGVEQVGKRLAGVPEQRLGRPGAQEFLWTGDEAGQRAGWLRTSRVNWLNSAAGWCRAARSARVAAGRCGASGPVGVPSAWFGTSGARASRPDAGRHVVSRGRQRAAAAAVRPVAVGAVGAVGVGGDADCGGRRRAGRAPSGLHVTVVERHGASSQPYQQRTELYPAGRRAGKASPRGGIQRCGRGAAGVRQGCGRVRQGCRTTTGDLPLKDRCRWCDTPVSAPDIYGNVGVWCTEYGDLPWEDRNLRSGARAGRPGPPGARGPPARRPRPTRRQPEAHPLVSPPIPPSQPPEPPPARPAAAQ